MVSTRAEIVTRRTYNRPKDKEGKVFETWEETIGRVISHQRWLWARAKKKPWQEEVTLKKEEEEELEKLGHSSSKGRRSRLEGHFGSEAQKYQRYVRQANSTVPYSVS